jgi:hypothetical protein
VCAAEFFRQRPNFSGDLADNIWPELATLVIMAALRVIKDHLILSILSAV